MAGDQKKSGKPIGRPAKNPEMGKRINAMFRINEATRDRLMAAAEASGRSMSEEIERRVSRSFEDVDLLVSHFGSKETLELVRSIALLARAVENQAGHRWADDALSKRDLYEAIERFCRIFFYEQGEENSAADVPLRQMGDLGSGHRAAEFVAGVMGLQSQVRDRIDALLATPEGKAAMAGVQRDAAEQP